MDLTLILPIIHAVLLIWITLWKTSENYCNRNQCEIPKEKEIISLAYYEMERGNFDVSLLLMAAAIELLVKNIVNSHFDRQRVARNIENMRKNPKTREKPTVIKYLIILTDKYPFINKLDIDIDKIETLFKARNKIVHEGEPYYFSRDGLTKIPVDYSHTNDFMQIVKDFIEVKASLILKIKLVKKVREHILFIYI
ncbi:MAG: hypothetical protein MZV64_26770 [Ignavibacteriales bacterium]|nr:hypothetical protein [Ignavibacteriales bacterium]